MAEENPQNPQNPTNPNPNPGTKPEAPQVPEGYLPQDQVNQIIEQRLARERENYAKKLEALGFKDFDEVAKLKAAQAEREKDELAKKEQWRELAEKIRAEKDEELRKKSEEFQTLRRQYLGTQAQQALLRAATAHNAIAPEQVAQLVRDAVRVEDDGSVVVVDAQGQQLTNGKGESLTVDQYVEGFLDSNPHFRRAAGGTGAQGRSGGTPPSDVFDMAKIRKDPSLMQKNRDEIIRRMKSGELKP